VRRGEISADQRNNRDEDKTSHSNLRQGILLPNVL
jgi:hypothetical protein